MNELSIFYMLTEMKRLRKSVNIQLKRAPQGALQISSNGNRLSFFNVNNENGARKLNGIGRNPALIDSLAHKAYNQELQRRLNHNIEIIEKQMTRLLPLDPDSIIASLPAHFDILEKQVLIYGSSFKSGWRPSPAGDDIPARTLPLKLKNMAPMAWAEMPYRSNTKEAQHKIHISQRGITCRSKSELSILKEYDDLRIYYHYDEVLSLFGINISPDFIGLRADGSFVIHEHLGLHNKEYRDLYRKKELHYERAGFTRGDNLLYTYDDPKGGINMSLIREAIKDIYHL